MLAFFFLPVTVSCSVALAGLALSVTLLPLFPHWRDHECAGACATLVGFVSLLLYFLKLQRSEKLERMESMVTFHWRCS